MMQHHRGECCKADPPQDAGNQAASPSPRALPGFPFDGCGLILNRWIIRSIFLFSFFSLATSNNSCRRRLAKGANAGGFL